MGVFIGEFGLLFYSFFRICYHLALTYPLTQLDGTSKEAQSDVWTGSPSRISSCLTEAALRHRRRADVGVDESVGDAGECFKVEFWGCGSLVGGCIRLSKVCSFII
ncbi:hypothetical protein PILCRDRAFT_344189 [Piloderma croceum F 1598]|uniref:Uncharacterized protein n=1 Tax=Piloderma croceum (strain F 1598) TaxID=765440 RepID=A0A0C3BHI2_PILCF|nr:hypothetical protein PILCRDRAFT_344189 [Piloderma croceum F 1598]